jgi:hypothetical protein
MKATNDMTNTSGTRRATGWSCACLLLLAGQATAQPGGQPPMIRAIPIVRMPAAQPPEPPEESAKAGDGESPDAPEGAVKPDAKKDASVALPPEEVAELKAAWEAASPEEQAELRAYYADLGVDVDKALGLDAAKGEAQARAMELQGAMREMEFARTPQAVLAARSKLAFGQVPQPNASSASPMDVARWVHLQAMAGEWGVLGEWLRQRPEAESQGIYSTILQGMNRGDAGLLPEEVVSLSEAAPGDLKPWQLATLSGILKKSVSQAGTAKLLASLKTGTRFFGETTPEHRSRTVEFLAGADLMLEAYAYLPSLEEATAAGDAGVLMVHAGYKMAMAEREAERAERLRLEAWELYSKVSTLDRAAAKTRREAIDRGLSLLTSVPRARITPWLETLFADQALGPAALELMALKAAAIGDEKQSEQQRAEAILTLKEAADVLLARTTAENESLRVPLRMMTAALLTEMENAVKAKGRQQALTREAQVLLRAVPGRQWLDALEPSMAARAAKACIALATVADETDMALTMLADAATRTPEAAAAIADDFLTHWQSRLSPAGDMEDEQRLFFFYREAIPAAPLTRGRQRRNLERLQTVMSTIAATGVDPRTLPSIASAFKACHGRSEVFDREEIVRVFGPVEAMPATTAVSLAGTMAANLNGDWRNRAAQQETGTKRSDNEIAALVDKGYGVAMELAEAASAREPNSWRVAALRAGLAFDRMQFRNAQKKADAASLNDARKAAFEAFEAAAGVYAAALARGEEREDARVFTVWFGAALGTPQLNFVNVEELPTEGSIGDDQIERIRKAIIAMEPDAAFRHLSDFASDVSEAVMRSDPEVKPRLVKHALRIIGDHPAGASLRAMDELYRDLVKEEIRLRLTVDGPDRIGTGRPFGLLVSLRFTNAVDRETGGFAKYLQNNVWGRVGRDFREINYRDRFQKEIETSLGKGFTIESVGFFDPFMPARGVVEQEQGGWLEKPMAYVVLSRKEAAVDRIPPVTMDMQFDDQSGPVTLALPSNAVPVASSAEHAARPSLETKVEQVIDVRNARSGDKGGVITMEVRIRGKGVVPDLRDALEGVDTAIGGYEIGEKGIETRPIQVLQEGTVSSDRFFFSRPQAPKGGYPEPDDTGMYRLDIERSWLVTYTPTGGARADAFTVPTLKAGVAAGAEARHYTDMDLIPVEGGVVPVEHRWTTGGLVATGLGVVVLAGMAVWAVRRRGTANSPATGATLVPDRVTPLSVVTALRLLRETQSNLDSATLKALTEEIASLERVHFGPGAAGGTGDLDTVLQRWRGRLGG